MRAPGGDAFTQISAADNVFVAITETGSLYGWGNNLNGAVGTVGSPTTPARIATPEGLRFTQVSVGTYDTLALDADGAVWAWGSNDNGEVGIGSTSMTRMPVKSHTPEGVTFKQVSAGYRFSLALASDGALYAWGRNLKGALSDGTTTDRLSPVKSTMPDGVAAYAQVSAGARETAAAIGSNGVTYTWGDNYAGSLGVGRLTYVGYDFRTTPGPIDLAVTVNKVLFGDAAGTDLTQNGNTWTVTSPAGCGVKDVTAKYTQYGAEHTAVTKSGFAQGSAPQITVQPQGASAHSGDRVTLSAAATGDNEPTVQWQQAATADGPWGDIPGATTAETTITPSKTGLVRAVFSNCIGTATSEAATLTVTAATPTPTPSTGPSSAAPGGTPASGESSAAAAGSQVSTSGSASGPAAGVAAAALFLALGAAIAAGYKARGNTRN